MDAETWSWIEEERRSLADLLAGCTSQQRAAPSLCSEWTVREVAAHLAMTAAAAPDVGTMVRALARTRGKLWPAGRDVAVAWAGRRSDEQLVADLRRDAASRRRPVFVVEANILPDLLVHGQDIAVPLGIHRPVPATAGDRALERLWSMDWPFHARRRLRGVQLRVAGGGWTAGSGSEVSGSRGDLLLLVTGRTHAALGRLDGPGVDLLRRSTHDDRNHDRNHNHEEQQKGSRP